MSVDFVPAAHVRAVTRQIEEARQRTLDGRGVPPATADANYWEPVFEANAAEVLATLPNVTLTPDHAVRYRFFGQHERDLLIRPFAARTRTDVEPVRRVLDWHPPPDSLAASAAAQPTQDVTLLYRHFTFPRTAIGIFEYWLAMQEVWASGRWAHSHLIASADELSQITAADGWDVLHPIEAYEPAIVLGDGSARLAVLMHCPIGRFEVTLQQIEIAADQSLHYGDPITVAAGPKGYVL